MTGLGSPWGSLIVHSGPTEETRRGKIAGDPMTRVNHTSRAWMASGNVEHRRNQSTRSETERNDTLSEEPDPRFPSH